MNNIRDLVHQNDPIDHQIKRFLFCDFENKVRHSRGYFSLFSRRNLTFKHSLDVEIDVEEDERKRFKALDVQIV